MKDEKRNKRAATTAEPLSREQWISRAIAAAAMMPGKRKPTRVRKQKPDKD